MSESLFEQLGGRNLVVRVISAVSLLPIVLAAVWFGDIYFRIALAVAGIAMFFEWLSLVGVEGLERQLMLAIGAIGLIAFVILIGEYPLMSAAAGVAAGAAVISLAGVIFRRRTMVWTGGGVIYVGIPILALYSLRVHPDGALWVLWTLFIVWAMDVGGYFAGKGFGGPKLAPRISPKKTWSGLIGGAALALIVGGAIAYFADLQPRSLLFVMAPLLAIWAQVGDIAESAVKRHFGVKDASGLIPGHGGILDRVDGLIFVAPVVALFLCLNPG